LERRRERPGSRSSHKKEIAESRGEPRKTRSHKRGVFGKCGENHLWNEDQKPGGGLRGKEKFTKKKGQGRKKKGFDGRQNEKLKKKKLHNSRGGCRNLPARKCGQR